MAEKNFRDLLYLDFDKAASIWSQLEGGLRKTIAVSEDSGREQHAGATLGIPKVAEVKLGGDYASKRSVLDTRVLHHDILNCVDAKLTNLGLVVNLAEELDINEADAEAVRQAIGTRPYLKATGDSVLEDYRRILAITDQFNNLAKFISQCGLQGIKKSPEYTKLQETLGAMREDVRSTKDRNQKAVKQRQLSELESMVAAMSQPSVQGVEEWLVQGIRLFISTFMPTRINFRIYPFRNCPSFQVICNLKRECFVDQDLEHLLYGYGNRPNVPLTVFGLLTSIPPKDAGDLFDPMTEFEDTELSSSDRGGFEKGFRGLFGAMEGLEGLVRYSRYPNVTVHPIAIFRSFELIHAD